VDQLFQSFEGGLSDSSRQWRFYGGD